MLALSFWRCLTVLQFVHDFLQSARALFFEEENNVNDRDIAKDLEMHSNACREFKRILLKIKDLKASGKTEEVSIYV